MRILNLVIISNRVEIIIFEIIFEKKFDYRSLNKDDNELGEAADKFGFEIGILFTAYGVKKRRTE